MQPNSTLIVLTLVLVATLFTTVQAQTPGGGSPTIVITEINYNPPESGSDSTEFIELYNPGPAASDMTGVVFSSGVAFNFPGITIPAGEFFIVCVDSVAMEDRFNINSMSGVQLRQWTSGGLSNGGEPIALRLGGLLLDTLRYDDAAPWPTSPDGNGHTLVLCGDPATIDNTDGNNWAACDSAYAIGVMINGHEVFATPGSLDGCAPSFSVSLSSTEPCTGIANGTVTATVSGGTTDYTYSWSQGSADTTSATADTIANVMAGTYTVTVTDGGGITATASTTLSNLCPSVQGLSEVQLLDTAAVLTWDTICGVQTYKILYKPVGAPGWSVAFKYNGGNTKTITGLSPGTKYKWTIRPNCGTAWGDAAEPTKFWTADGPCDAPANLATSPVGFDIARLNWDVNPYALVYEIRWTEVGVASWTTKMKDPIKTHHWLTGLSSATTYKWQIRSWCTASETGAGDWSAEQTFTTAAPKTIAELGATGSTVQQLAVFPNPGSGLFNVVLPEGLESCTISVADLSGRIVESQQSNGAQLQAFDLGHLPQGVYLLEARNAYNAQVVRLVIH